MPKQPLTERFGADVVADGPGKASAEAPPSWTMLIFAGQISDEQP